MILRGEAGQLILWASVLLDLQKTFVTSCVSGGGGCCGGAGFATGLRRSPAAKTIPQQTTSGLRGAFGGSIQTDSYVSDSSGIPIVTDSDLDCFGITSTICRWKNANEDTLEWLRGSGSPNMAMSSTIVGTSVSPIDPFLVLASTPRLGTEAGLLVSDPISCQVGDGELSYRHWLSRSRNPGNEPTLRVCWRMHGETILRDCQGTTNPAPGPSYARIPGPINQPFEIVIEGAGFTNEPEGGVILLDDIDFTADIPAFCDSLNGFDRTLRNTSSTGSGLKPNSLAKRVDDGSCSSIHCNFVLNDFCNLNPFGYGAVDVGKTIGWQVTNGNTNRANPLTGIHSDFRGSQLGTFAVADFPDPRQEAINPDLQYVLESSTVRFDLPVYLNFERYMATEGTLLKVCIDDPNDFNCIWESPPLTRGAARAQNNLQWREEVVRLPEGSYKLFLVARYDDKGSFNKGQIGISYLKLFADPSTSQQLC